MLQAFGYAIAVATLLGVVGICVEHLLARWALPRRTAWILAMLMSMLFPLLMMSRAQPGPAAEVVVQSPRASLAEPVAGMQLRTGPAPVAANATEAVPATNPADSAATMPAIASVAAPSSGSLLPVQSAKWWHPPLPSDRSVFVLWFAISAVLLLYVCATSLLLHRRASAWQRETVLGHDVLVSADTGPALLGALRPRMIVPRWCLDESVATQALILQHERQHIAGRDPMLVWAAVLAVVALPWNLPLWWQLRRLRLAIELDCDARVLRAGADARDYGEVLLAVTRRATSLPGVAIAMSQPISALERRIRSLTIVAPRRAGLRFAVVLSMAVAGAAAAAMLKAPVLPEFGSAEVAVTPPASQSAGQPMPVAAGQGGAGATIGAAAATGSASMKPGPAPAPQLPPAPARTLQQAPSQPVASVVGTAAAAPATPAGESRPAPLSNRMRFTGGIDSRQQALQAAVEKYPEIANGPERTGVYVVTIAFNWDGSVYSSQMRFSTEEDASVVQYDLSQQMPTDGDGLNGTTVPRGTQIPGGGMLRNDIHLNTTTLPRDYDESRSNRRVHDAVRQKHADLMISPTSGKLNVITVLMTEDGRIGRERIENLRLEEMRSKVSEDVSAVDFSVLGVTPQQIGRMGLTGISRPAPGGDDVIEMKMPDGTVRKMPRNELEILMIRFAWPARAGEALAQSREAASASPSPSTRLLPMSRITRELAPDPARVRADSRRVGDRARTALVEKYPEISSGPERDGWYLVAITLRTDGSVYRSGLKYTTERTNNDLQELRAFTADGNGTMSMDTLRKGEVLADGKTARANVDFQYTLLPDGFDESRSRGAVREAIQAARLDQQSGRLTVVMTDDGRIANQKFEPGSRQEMMRGPSTGVFAALGLDAQQVGAYGMDILSRSEPGAERSGADAQRELVVWYAWPRRAGEPVGGFRAPSQSMDQQPMYLAQREHDTVMKALAQSLFPDAATAPERYASRRPWVLLSSQGEVLRSGTATLNQGQTFIANVHLANQMPGVRFAELENVALAAAGGQNVNVALVWMAADSPLPPAAGNR